MCDMVEVLWADRARRLCETKEELRKAIGAEPVKDKRYKAWNDGDCLCPCDMKATAESAGFVLRKIGVMEYLMTAKCATQNDGSVGPDASLSAAVD